MRLVALIALGMQLIAALAGSPHVGAVAPESPHFARTWERTDRPVSELLVSRSWLWGPEANTELLTEPYAESPGGLRDVQYFDKSRMEINNPSGNPESPWYVTNGLLVVELMTGQMQIGDASFTARKPAENNVAGDPNDADGPTYQTFASLRDLPARVDGELIIQRVDRDGNVTSDPSLAPQGVTSAHRVQVPGIDHQVASPFWDFMNSTGLIFDPALGFVDDALFLTPFYATGLPVTEAYWATVEVAGTPKDVLTQCFERRCLTFTPDNAPGWQVEAGNVGLHYRDWRNDPDFDIDDPGPDPTPTPEPSPTPGPTPPPGESDLLINEIMYLPGDAETIEWVELYNSGDGAADLDGWTLANGNGTDPVALPDWTLAVGSYLIVYFGDGTDDPDDTDGSASYYAGADQSPFFTAFDVGLYDGAPSAATIEDFVAWTYIDDYAGGAVQGHAVDAGVWTNGAAYNAYGGVDPASIEAYQRIHIVSPDESIGRDGDSGDTNSPDDWAAFGGTDALEPTPGERNFSELLAEIQMAVESPEPAHALQQAPTLPQPMKPWTILVYNDARDTNLAGEFAAEMQAMATVGSSVNVNVVVRTHHNAGVATTYYVQQGMPALLQRDTGVNPGTSAALSGFINWAKTNFPAEKYAIVFGGHGDGWKGLLIHDSQDFLRMSELSAGLSALGQQFETVKFDACLMAQVEVAHQIQPQAKTMVASEQISYGGFPWADFLDELQDDPSVDGSTVADRLTQLHAQAYERVLAQIPDNPGIIAAQNQLRAYTWSSVDTATVSNQLVPAVSAFATELIDDVETIDLYDLRDDNHQLIIKHDAREQVMEYADSNFIDLLRFAELVEMTLLKASDLAPPVIAGVEAAVRWESHGPTATFEQSYGLSIYFPRALLHPDYPFPTQMGAAGGATSCLPATPVCISALSFDDPLDDPALPGRTHLYKLDAAIKIPSIAGAPHAMFDDPAFTFPNSSTWDEFLQRYYKPVADACIRLGDNCVPEATVEVGQTVELSGNGSSDSDGSIGPLDDEPGLVDYYWDFDTSVDGPNPLPNYRPGTQFFDCTDSENRDEDCDRDEIDEADDDADAVGKTVFYTCVNPGDFPIRLMVWDEHHRQSREAFEDVTHNQGRHWLHFNVDDAEVLIHCAEPSTPDEPIKESSADEVVRGETFEYTINVPANPDLNLPGDAEITDVLPELVQFVEILECSAGTCGYDEAEREVSMQGATISPGGTLVLRFSVTVIEEIVPLAGEVEVPIEILNCATVSDGLFFQEVCVSTDLIEDSTGPPSTGTESALGPR